MTDRELLLGHGLFDNYLTARDSILGDTIGPLPYPFKDKSLFTNSGKNDSSALYLKKPSNVRTVIEYDPITGDYLISEKVGDVDYRLPLSLSREEYLKTDLREAIDKYWRQKMSQNTLDQKSQLVPQFRISSQAFSKVFGTNVVNIKPQGYVEMSLGGTHQQN